MAIRTSLCIAEWAPDQLETQFDPGPGCRLGPGWNGCVWKCCVLPQLPNGFADHYPYEKWLAIIGNINPTFSDKPKSVRETNVTSSDIVTDVWSWNSCTMWNINYNVIMGIKVSFSNMCRTPRMRYIMLTHQLHPVVTSCIVHQP